MFENNRIKQVLMVSGVITLLAIAFSAVAYVRVYDRSIQPGSFRSFAVTGEGKAVAVPDVAEFTASVITQGGKDLATLQKSNTEKINKVVDFIKSKGVKSEDIQTSGYQINPRYQSYSCTSAYSIPAVGVGVSPEMAPVRASVNTCPPADIVGYTITQTVQVKVRDFSKAGEVLAGVVNAGANSVTQLQFTVDDPLTVQSEARAKAIAEARKQAEAIAKAGGFSVGKLLSLDEGGYMPYVSAKYGMGGDMAVSEASVAPTIEPGSKDHVIRVTLRYEID
jgi:hypothetical protein